MKEVLQVREPNDYARHIGAPVYHPHVSVIHYDEVGAIPHTLNRYNVYGFFLQKDFPEGLTYGVGQYKAAGGSLLAVSPGQIGGVADDGFRRVYHGWVLMFDQEFMHGTPLEHGVADYHYFSYNANEALVLTEDEQRLLWRLMETVRDELAGHREEDGSDRIVRDYIMLIADYCNRFYARQFKEGHPAGGDVLARFQQVLIGYYRQRLQYKYGVPSVKHCASELCLSPNYFGDVVRNALGDSPLHYIREFVVHMAKDMIIGGKNITEVSGELGFDYPQHFTRVFKKATGQTPSEWKERVRNGA